jgi:hypothetical protein
MKIIIYYLRKVKEVEWYDAESQSVILGRSGVAQRCRYHGERESNMTLGQESKVTRRETWKTGKIQIYNHPTNNMYHSSKLTLAG